jgi:membrane-anchored protein YejM (alkaline phosphatase superfamily)
VFIRRRRERPGSARWGLYHRGLARRGVDFIDSSVFRERAQAVQTIDQMIGQIEGALAASGLSNDTYLVFSSDNGLHTESGRLSCCMLTYSTSSAATTA